MRWASQPPDDQHLYGHEKAEYFSAGAEGSMILLAALTIAWLALDRLLHPAALRTSESVWSCRPLPLRSTSAWAFYSSAPGGDIDRSRSKPTATTS